MVPFIHFLFRLSHHIQLGFRVIDQGRQIVSFHFRQLRSKEIVEFLLDFAGTGIEDVQKGFMFAVDI